MTPPSISRSVPVMNPASLPSKNAPAAAISSKVQLALQGKQQSSSGMHHPQL
jgi:hypothetical protein